MAKHAGATIELFRFTIASTVIMEAVVLYRKFAALGPDVVRAMPDVIKLLESVDGDQAYGDAIHGLRSKFTDLNLDALAGSREVLDRFAFETATTRWVDAFEYYLSGIVLRALRQAPGAIGDMNVSVSQLLADEDNGQLILEVIERKVRDVMMKGIDEVAEFLGKKFGVIVDKSTEHYANAKHAVEVRHLFTQNRGLVDRRFMLKAKRADLTAGMPYPLDWSWMGLLATSFLEVSGQIDRSFAKTLHLKLATEADKLALGPS